MKFFPNKISVFSIFASFLLVSLYMEKKTFPRLLSFSSFFRHHLPNLNDHLFMSEDCEMRSVFRRLQKFVFQSVLREAFQFFDNLYGKIAIDRPQNFQLPKFFPEKLLAKKMKTTNLSRPKDKSYQDQYHAHKSGAHVKKFNKNQLFLSLLQFEVFRSFFAGV